MGLPCSASVGLCPIAATTTTRCLLYCHCFHMSCHEGMRRKHREDVRIQLFKWQRGWGVHLTQIFLGWSHLQMASQSNTIQVIVVLSCPLESEPSPGTDLTSDRQSSRVSYHMGCIEALLRSSNNFIVVEV